MSTPSTPAAAPQKPAPHPIDLSVAQGFHELTEDLNAGLCIGPDRLPNTPFFVIFPSQQRFKEDFITASQLSAAQPVQGGNRDNYNKVRDRIKQWVAYGKKFPTGPDFAVNEERVRKNRYFTAFAQAAAAKGYKITKIEVKAPDNVCDHPHAFLHFEKT